MSQTPLDAARTRTWTETVPAAPAKAPPPAGNRRTLILCATLAVIAFDLLAYTWGRMFFTDTWLSLTGGRYILEHGLPHVDTLTVAAHGRPWVDQQWLAHVIYYAVYEIGGYPLVGMFSAASIATALGLLAWVMSRRGAAPITVLGMMIFPLCILLFSAEARAQTLTYPLYVTVLWLILDDAQRGSWSRKLVWLFPILAVWANLHGSVLMAAGLCVLYLGARAVQCARRGEPGAWAYAALAGASALATVITPYGTAILAYYPRILADPALHSIAEWQHSGPSPLNVPFFVTLAFVAGFAAVAWRRGLARGPLVLWLLVGALTAMAFYAVRNQVWFGFAAALLGAQCVTDAWPTFGRTGGPADRRMIGAVVGLAAIATAVVVVAVARTPATRFDSVVSYPAMRAADSYLGSHPGTTVLADDITGTDLLWRYPRLAGRVAYDARTEIYRPASIHSLARFLSGKRAGWRHAIAGYTVIALSCKWHADACAAVGRLPGWRRLPGTPGGLVMVKRS